MSSFRLIRTCVTIGDANALLDMIDGAIDISRRTFLHHVDRAQMTMLEKELGYSSHFRRGLTMARDYHVSYHRSKFKGRPVYYFCWSGIEHIFAEK